MHLTMKLQNKSQGQNLALDLLNGQSVNIANGRNVTISLADAFDVNDIESQSHIIVRSVDDVSKIQGLFLTTAFKYITTLLHSNQITYQVHPKLQVTILDNELTREVYSKTDQIIIQDDTEVAHVASLDNSSEEQTISKYFLEGVANMLVDVSKIGEVSVLRPGLLLSDLQEVSPVKVKKAYESSEKIKMVPRLEISNIIGDNYDSVLAPKEFINEHLDNNSRSYYKSISDEATQTHYVNTGSHTSPKIALKNLYKNIQSATDAVESKTGVKHAIVWVNSVKDNINETAHHMLDELVHAFDGKLEVFVVQ